MSDNSNFYRFMVSPVVGSYGICDLLDLNEQPITIKDITEKILEGKNVQFYISNGDYSGATGFCLCGPYFNLKLFDGFAFYVNQGEDDNGDMTVLHLSTRWSMEESTTARLLLMSCN